MSSRLFILLTVAILFQGCVTGVRPFVGIRHETYTEEYDNENGNPRFETELLSPDREKMAYSGKGIEIGLINRKEKVTATGSIAYTKFNDMKSTAAGAGNPEVKTDITAVGLNVVLGYNLFPTPFSIRPEVILKYQTYYFEDQTVPTPLRLIGSRDLVSHSSVGLGATVQIPFDVFSILLRGYYTFPSELDNDELDKASSVDISVDFVFGIPGTGNK